MDCGSTELPVWTADVLSRCVFSCRLTRSAMSVGRWVPTCGCVFSRAVSTSAVASRPRTTACCTQRWVMSGSCQDTYQVVVPKIYFENYTGGGWMSPCGTGQKINCHG